MMELLANNNSMVVCPADVLSLPEDGKALMYSEFRESITEVVFNVRTFFEQINKTLGSSL